MAYTGGRRSAVAAYLAARWWLIKGSDCLYIDDECIVRLRRQGRGWAKAWAIRLDCIQDVSFRGGSFVTGELTARLSVSYTALTKAAPGGG